MPYIGNKPGAKYASLTRQTFSSPTGTSHTLSQTVTNSDDLLLYINNVKQNPADYTASGTTLTTASLAGGTEMYCLYYGKTTETVAPPASSVGDSHIVDVASSKLTGTIADARFPATLPASSGANLTNLPAHTGNVAFPATQVASADANTLDDYEEGTFTLALASHTATGSGQSYSSNTGTYTKIGRLVLCAGYFDPSSSGDLDTGHNTKLTGFPFTSQTHGHSRYSLTINDPGVMSKGTDASVQAYLPGGATYAYMHKSNVTTGVSPLTIGELNNGSFGYTVVYNT